MPTINYRPALRLLAAGLLLAAAASARASHDAGTYAPLRPLPRVSSQHVQAILTEWPQESRAAAELMISRYGAPDTAVGDSLTWKAGGAGPWLGVVVRRSGVVEQSVRYQVPHARRYDVDRLAIGVSYDRDSNVLTAASESESTNILALNVAVSYVEGKRSFAQSREFFHRTLDLGASGKSSPEAQNLMFEPYRGFPMPFWWEQMPEK